MKNTQEMPLATEILHDMKVCVKRWKLAFFSVAIIEVITVIAFVIAIK